MKITINNTEYKSKAEAQRKANKTDSYQTVSKLWWKLEDGVLVC